MNQHPKKPVSPLRRPFVIAGALIGVALSVWYLVNNFGRVTPVPDPVWAKFVNIALFMFASIYVCNLLRLLVDRLLKKK